MFIQQFFRVEPSHVGVVDLRGTHLSSVRVQGLSVIGLTLRFKIAQKPFMVRPLGPKP